MWYSEPEEIRILISFRVIFPAACRGILLSCKAGETCILETMSIYIHKSHNVSVLIYHLVCPTKYRRVVIDEKVDLIIKQTCLGIADRYQIHFLEIGTDKDHVHFLMQSVPTYEPTKITRIVKSITARAVFAQAPEVKRQLWGGEFWTDGYYISTVGKNGSKTAVSRYVKNQGVEQEYAQIHKGQLTLWG